MMTEVHTVEAVLVSTSNTGREGLVMVVGWGMRMGMGSTLEHEDEFLGEDKNIMSLV